MFKTFALASAAAVTALTAMPVAASAQSYGYYDAHQSRRAYEAQRQYEAQRHYEAQRYNNYYGRRCSGTTGTILGAVAGGLLGREVAGRGDRTTGAIIGGAAGALAGRAVNKEICKRR